MVFNATSLQYFSYIVAVSFIGVGNESNRRKPPDVLSQSGCSVIIGSVKWNKWQFVERGKNRHPEYTNTWRLTFLSCYRHFNKEGGELRFMDPNVPVSEIISIKQKYKRATNNLQKTKDGTTRTQLKPGLTSGAPEGLTVLALLVAPIVIH
jgi:hypothetical protein